MQMQVYEVAWLGNDGRERWTNVQAKDNQDAVRMFKEHWAGTAYVWQIKEVKLM